MIKQDMSGHSEGVITEQTHDMDQKREQNRQEKDKTNTECYRYNM